ncbi:uncharacterized protein JN550_004924 [Neoarthrinium moseri]|uniref:uncharacterized protein n=1 Tax=Neoarthrinium moseri TaxID=1658444 RepID=UPI001FDBC0BA|nr:uncharacterized protein JN550_004924 [Neoarthrinium moseri]KAI1870778.1 hypothetical protein JN550_004924 [Neoarthrinium moseri]
MAFMSRNSSTQSLMGFSVHQPAIGAPLQFFPAMGSKQLDDMIDAYVPGSASILDKRTAVSMEFFGHTIQTGELFKFFLVYPAMGSSTASPASSGIVDSGYGSSFNTSPVMSESQWTQASNSSFSASNQKVVTQRTAASSSKAGDFSHIPGMKIMTKDGRDVTNSASRGCKTKEQRDHAHLMRIIKACDACKKKKTRCDPSHKKRTSSASSSPEPKSAKKVKKTASSQSTRRMAASQATTHIAPAFEPSVSESFSFDDSFDVAAAPAVDEWDQFITYDEEVSNAVPNDYDFFFDPAGYFSPTTSDSNSVSVSPSQVLTPAQSQPITPTSGLELGNAVHYADNALAGLGDDQQPILPYLHPGGAEVGNNYVDFALYSPGSTCLDEDPAFLKEVAAPLVPGSPRQQQLSRSQRPISRSSADSELAPALREVVSSVDVQSHGLPSVPSSNQCPALDGANNCSSRAEVVVANDGSDHGYYNERDQRSSYGVSLHEAAAGSYIEGPADPTESRVPRVTIVSPSDSSQLLAPQRPLQSRPSQSSAVDEAALAPVVTENVKPRRSAQTSTVTTDELSRTLSTYVPSSAAATAVTTRTAMVSTVEEPLRERIFSLVDHESFNHQRLPRSGAFTGDGDGLPVSSARVENTVAGRLVQDGSIISRERYYPSPSTTVPAGQDLSEPASTVFRSALPKDGVPAGVAMGQPFTAVSASGVDAAAPGVLAHFGMAILSVVGMLALAAPSAFSRSNTRAVAVFHSAIFESHQEDSPPHSSWSMSRSEGRNSRTSSTIRLLGFISAVGVITVCTVVTRALDLNQVFVSAAFVALSLVASRQEPILCENKLGPFTQALHSVKQLSGNFATSVKSKISGFREGTFTLQSRYLSAEGNVKLGFTARHRVRN